MCYQVTKKSLCSFRTSGKSWHRMGTLLMSLQVHMTVLERVQMHYFIPGKHWIGWLEFWEHLVCSLLVAAKQNPQRLSFKRVYFMSPNLRQRGKKKGNAAKAAWNICIAFGDGAVSEATAQKWFRRFNDGDKSLDGTPCEEGHCIINKDKLKSAVKSDPRQMQHLSATRI